LVLVRSLTAALVLAAPVAAWASSFIHEAQLLAGDAAATDRFGGSVSVSGDTAVVGAPADDTPGGADAGSAYVFVRSGTTWTFQQQLLASDGAAGDGFGLSVSIFGDTVVVGAPMDDTAAGADSGSAYVFLRSGTTWTQQQQLLPADLEAGQGVGFAVSLSGETAVVGGPNDNTAAGSAYAFVRSGAVWTQQQKLVAGDAALGDQLGISVSLSGDTVIVGAFFDDAPQLNQGSAYVFVRSGTTWSQQQKLTASDAAFNDLFGLSVALSGDTAAVGAVFADTAGGVDSGAAYVFVRSGTTWSEQQKLIASDAGSSDLFGVALSATGDDTVVVGASDDDTTAGSNAGSAYVFGRVGTVWSEHRRLFAPDAAALDQLGASVSVAGDTVLVGAPFDDTAGGADAGSAHVFRGMVPVELEIFTVE
jgi:hypothetical protein